MEFTGLTESCPRRFLRRASSFWKRHRPKLIDWLMIIVLVLLDELFQLSDLIRVHHFCIPWERGTDGNPCSTQVNGRDPEINYPYREDTVSPAALEFQGLLWTFLIFALNLVFTKLFDQKRVLRLFSTNSSASNLFSWRHNLSSILSKLECYLRCTFSSVLAASVVTGVIKEAVGRPRPDYYNYKTVDPVDAHLAFPSGHTSFAFSIFFLHSLFLFRALCVVRAIRFHRTRATTTTRRTRRTHGIAYDSYAYKTRDDDWDIGDIEHMGNMGSMESVVSVGSVDSMDSARSASDRNGNDLRGLLRSGGYSIQTRTFMNYLMHSGDVLDAAREKLMQTEARGNEREVLYRAAREGVYKNGNVYFGLVLFYYLRHNVLLSGLIAFLPTLGAIYVGCTRIIDYKHRVSDVLAGALLGAGVAYIVFVLFSDEFYYGPARDEQDTDDIDDVKNNNINNNDNNNGGVRKDAVRHESGLGDGNGQYFEALGSNENILVPAEAMQGDTQQKRGKILSTRGFKGLGRMKGMKNGLMKVADDEEDIDDVDAIDPIDPIDPVEVVQNDEKGPGGMMNVGLTSEQPDDILIETR